MCARVCVSRVRECDGVCARTRVSVRVRVRVCVRVSVCRSVCAHLGVRVPEAPAVSRSCKRLKMSGVPICASKPMHTRVRPVTPP